MANIVQAAKWMREGRTVQRKLYAERWWCSPWEPRRIGYDVPCADGGNHTLDLFDLQAEDWELITQSVPEQEETQK